MAAGDPSPLNSLIISSWESLPSKLLMLIAGSSISGSSPTAVASSEYKYCIHGLSPIHADFHGVKRQFSTYPLGFVSPPTSISTLALRCVRIFAEGTTLKTLTLHRVCSATIQCATLAMPTTHITA
jgi:hypothetical protein